MLHRLRAPLLALLGLLLCIQPARATWSVILVNRQTGEVVIACATCLPNFDLASGVPVVRVGIGAAAAQSLVDSSGQNRQLIFDGLAAGLTPTEILDALAIQDGGAHPTRQYGIVNRADPAVKFTGQNAGPAKRAIAGEFGANGEWAYSIQGNVLTAQSVVEAAVVTLETAPGDAGQKVAAAMETARSLGGDGRCSCGAFQPAACGAPPPAPFKSAHVGFFIIARQGDTDGTCGAALGCATGDYFFKSNIIAGPAAVDPVFQLQDAYDAWRLGRVGLVDGLTSELERSADSLPADGATGSEWTLRLRDIDGTPLTTGGQTVSIAAADGTPLLAQAAVTDNADGSFGIAWTAGAQPGTQELLIEVDDGVRAQTIAPLPELRLDASDGLHCGRDAVSASLGDLVPLTLNSSPNGIYLILASASGTTPGIVLPQGLIPLNLDGVFNASLFRPNQVPFQNTLSDTDVFGRANAALDIAPGLLVPVQGGRIDLSAIQFNTLTATAPAGFDVLP